MMAMKRMSTLANHLTPEQRALEQNLFKYKEESARVRPNSFSVTYSILNIHIPRQQEIMENTTILHHHNEEHPESPSLPSPNQVDKMKKADDISLENRTVEPHGQQLAGVSLGSKGKGV